MSSPFFQLVYVSSGVKPFSNEELVQLLEKSRVNNSSLGVTGMLLYKDGDFMQALEGPEDVVRQLSAKIAKDPRHHGFVTLVNGASPAREFPDWSMGFQDLSLLNLRELPGYTTFMDSPLRAHSFAENPALCRGFLLHFKNNPRCAKAVPVHAHSS
jgi:Sensors of blue-light using FAD